MRLGYNNKKGLTMRLCFVIGLFFLFAIGARAQAPSTYANTQQNLVPNGSFEEFSSYPLGWFYKGKDYSRLMKFWSSPTHASPDIYHPKVRIPIYWTQKGFGIERPRSGKTMSGITVFGCKDGKPHCREYLQIQMMEPLVVGQRYHAEFYTTALSDSKLTNNLGMYFSPNKRDEITDEVMEANPQIHTKNIIRARNGIWHKVEGQFTATDTSKYLIIGNFFPDSLTQTDNNPKSYKYGYYYIDDVKVHKVEPIISQPIKKDDLCCIEYTVGKTITLKNIFFETDKSELLPQSYKELNQLLQVLMENPTMIIEIQGHTDNQGSYKYNIRLSRDRAQAVVDYLKLYGIEKERLYYKGFGDTRPIDTNETETGRQMNRRVAFVIMKK